MPTVTYKLKEMQLSPGIRYARRATSVLREGASRR